MPHAPKRCASDAGLEHCAAQQQPYLQNFSASDYSTQSYATKMSSAVPESRGGRGLAVLDAVWDVPIGLGLRDTGLSFVRVNETLAGLDGLPVDAHYESGETLARLPAAFAEGLRQAASGEAHDVDSSLQAAACSSSCIPCSARAIAR